MPDASLLISPVVGAAIGYFTNWLAIRMLFRPHTEKRLFNRRLPFTPGLIPKERARLTQKVAETVSQYVLTPDVLARELSSAGLLDKLADPTKTIGEWLAAFGVKDKLTEALTDFLQNAGYEPLAAQALNGLRQRIFAEGRTVGEIMPDQTVAALKNAAAAYWPKAVAYIRQWPEDNPWLDEKLTALVKTVIEENFGRLVGIFIDHNKVYANIKKSVFAYLSDEESRQFLLSRLEAAIDAFCAAECRAWESRLPDDAFLLEKLSVPMPLIAEAAQTLSARLFAVPMTTVVGFFTQGGQDALRRVLEKAAAFVAAHMQVEQMVQDKLDAFSVSEAETLIQSVVNRELRMITVVGGVLGFLIGLAPVVTRLLAGG